MTNWSNPFLSITLEKPKKSLHQIASEPNLGFGGSLLKISKIDSDLNIINRQLERQELVHKALQGVEKRAQKLRIIQPEEPVKYGRPTLPRLSRSQLSN
jgi:hypothetical protein